MTRQPANRGTVRAATSADGPTLVSLWATYFGHQDASADEPWTRHAGEWFERNVDDTDHAWFPVIDLDGDIVAAAIGTLELGVPNPHSATGRSVRLANVLTVPRHRGRGHGTAVVLDVIRWAKVVGADRVDLSTTSAAERVYERLGFTRTSAPRMKLVL